MLAAKWGRTLKQSASNCYQQQFGLDVNKFSFSSYLQLLKQKKATVRA
jgi:hypothetical protein